MGYLRERSRVEPPGTARELGQRRAGGWVRAGKARAGEGAGSVVAGGLGEPLCSEARLMTPARVCLCVSLVPLLYTSIWSPVSVCAPV